MQNQLSSAKEFGFMQTQKLFTQSIRDPDKYKGPDDINAKRMTVYQELFYNNIENFLSSAFPVIRTIYKDEHWHLMVRDFIRKHVCGSPYFLQIAEEFLDYLQQERVPQAEDPAGLLELAHYEWAELALSISEDEQPAVEVDSQGDLLTGHPVLSPLAWLLMYQYPVHRMSKDYLPDEVPEQPTCLMMYRNVEDEIQFMEINVVTARLISQLEQGLRTSGREILQDIAGQLNVTDADSIVSAGLDSLISLRSRGIILGTAC